MKLTDQGVIEDSSTRDLSVFAREMSNELNSWYAIVACFSFHQFGKLTCGRADPVDVEKAELLESGASVPNTMTAGRYSSESLY